METLTPLKADPPARCHQGSTPYPGKMPLTESSLDAYLRSAEVMQANRRIAWYEMPMQRGFPRPGQTCIISTRWKVEITIQPQTGLVFLCGGFLSAAGMADMHVMLRLTGNCGVPAAQYKSGGFETLHGMAISYLGRKRRLRRDMSRVLSSSVSVSVSVAAGLEIGAAKIRLQYFHRFSRGLPISCLLRSLPPFVVSRSPEIADLPLSPPLLVLPMLERLALSKQDEGRVHGAPQSTPFKRTGKSGNAAGVRVQDYFHTDLNQLLPSTSSRQSVG